MKIKIPEFEKKSELFKWLKENKADHFYQKKSELKKADGFGCGAVTPLKKDLKTNKSEAVDEELKEIKVRPIINTTLVRDSHKDVHVDGLWDKSLQENQRIKHLQEHLMSFDKVIADKDDLKAYTKIYTWKELGFDFPGKTQALVFDSTVKKKRNPFMFDQYKDGHVDNHSVGMRYVKLALAINSDDEDYKEEKAEYDKWIDKIANKEEVKKDGYFWVVYEAKVIEGSAVPNGSNSFTPTMPIKTELTDEEKKQLKINETIKSFLNLPLE